MTAILLPPEVPPAIEDTMRGAVVQAGVARKARLVEAWREYRACRPCEPAGELLREFVKVIPKHERPAGRTLRRWSQLYAKNGAAALQDRRVRSYARVFEPALWDEFFGLLKSMGCVATRAHRVMRGKYGERWPSLSRVHCELRARSQGKRRRRVFDADLWLQFVALVASGAAVSIADADRRIREIARVTGQRWPDIRDVYQRLRAEHCYAWSASGSN